MADTTQAKPRQPSGTPTKTRSRVAVVHTTPASVLDDVGTAMRLAAYREHLPRDAATLLKINISWQHYYPACSTTPWQLEGVIKALQADGYKDLIPAHNGTVVVDPFEGSRNNKHKTVEQKYGLEAVYLDVPPVKWTQYRPKSKMLVLNDVYPEGIFIPDVMFGKNIVHLPTAKTHVFTTMTGAMKNAFGGLLHRNRHWTHSVIHETLVDLLSIQKEIHPGIFAVTDGTFAGDGPGPRAMRWHVKNVLIAGADQVAVDAVVAKMMGFDPLSLKFIRLAHEAGLGCGDVRDIEVVGEDISDVNWHFASGENTFASRGQKLIYWGPLKPLENALLRSPIAPWSFFASNLYHNGYWLKFIGNKRVREAMKTEWGKLFQSY
ncbi:MAG: DUF362 domain-containing protein [SAR202 cluster bacterium]|nr:DUF362 domain-containing protein [SAR202 cluster bacterium]